MSNSVQRAIASVTQLLAAVSDQVSGNDIVRREREAALATRAQMSERIESLRAGFSAIRERHTLLTNQLSAQRHARGQTD